jgi:hypothetical protein
MKEKTKKRRVSRKERGGNRKNSSKLFSYLKFHGVVFYLSEVQPPPPKE